MSTTALVPQRAAPAGLSAASALTWAALVVLAQTLAAHLCGALPPDPVRPGAPLVQWDGEWYARIINEGYHSPAVPTPQQYGNVGFFPAYPLTAGAMARLTGLPVDVALPLTAQLAAWGLWTYLLLLCRRWGVPSSLARWGVLVLALHPAAFFLVSGYSESLFLMAALGFVYWSDQPGRRAAVLAALHGVVLTATRLVGLPLVVYPLVRAWMSGERGRRWAAAALVGAVAGLGGLGYFAFCQLQFGRWDLYMRTQEAGWHVEPTPLALLSARVWTVGVPDLKRGVDPDFINRLAVPLTVLLFVGLLACEAALAWRRQTGWRQRAALYAAALPLFWLPADAFWSQHWLSMSRHTYAVWVLLALALGHLLARVGVAALPRGVRVALVVWLTASAALQLALLYRFTHGHWVA
jgi:hypothetical protein